MEHRVATELARAMEHQVRQRLGEHLALAGRGAQEAS